MCGQLRNTDCARGCACSARESHLWRFLLIALAIAVVSSFVLPGILTAWLPPTIERKQQRKGVRQRIESAGGWDVLRRDCASLAEQYKDTGFHSGWHQTNGLPPSLAILKPLTVECYQSKEASVSVVHVRVFGIHSTGGHSVPYFGLEVVCGPGHDRYLPKPHSNVALGNRYSTYSRVADSVYEIY